MGEDKALLPIVPGGPPLLAIVLERAASVATDVFVVASDRPRYAEFGADVYPDDYAEAGTLGGIATALGHARFPHCLVVACDMPFLNPSLLSWMAARPRDYDALVPRVTGESKQGGGHIWQTLHAIYGTGCLAPMLRRLAAGERKVIGFFDDVRVEEIDEATVRDHEPGLRCFFNANTPVALAEARAIVAAEHGRIGHVDDDRLYCSQQR